MSATTETRTQGHTTDITAAQPAMVTVYSRQGCVQCHTTHRALDRAGITYRTVDLDEDPDAAQRFREAGHQQLPVVHVGNRMWSGHQPDQIRSLRKRG